MKKRVFSAITAVFMMFSLFTTAFAANVDDSIIDFGDGYYMVVRVNNEPQATRASLIYKSKTGDIYNGTTQIGTMTVYGEFDISGSTAKALDGSVDGSGMSGWSYKSGSASCSGNKVTGTAKFGSGTASKSFTLTMTCSPSGTVS